MIPERCLIACQGSTVEYFVKDYIINMAWGDPEEFTIDWTVTGGTVMDVYDETDPKYGVKIKWSDTLHTGSIKIEVYTDSYYRQYWLCVRLINTPIADFEIIGEGEFCKNSPIFFNNLSVANGYGGIKSTLWDFGDGNYSSQYNPQHSYENAGDYEVTLTVTNWCNCESTYSMKISIVDKPAPIISCPGVVVEKETVTYTTEDPCGGKWIAEGGTIIDGGSGDYATIVWDGIDPAEGFGYIHYFSECTCPTTVKVPVVTKKALIKGDPFICEGDQNKFTLPQWPTTEFNWYIVYGDGSSTVIPTEQPNEVFVEGVQAGTHTLVCEYYNTLWGYSGATELEITVGKKAEITGNDTAFCAGSGTYTYTNVGGDPVTWTLMRDGTIVSGIPSYGNTFSHNFPVGGTYMLTATTDEGCVSEPFVIEVTQIPALTGEIQGQGFVCENLTYQYTYENDEPGTVLIWEASNGAVLQGNNTGNTVSVKFTGSGPYTLKVKRRSQDDPICWSPNELTKSIHKVNLIPTITNDTNPLNEFCPSSTTVFTANFAPGFIPDHIQWTLESDGSTPNSNFGNIVLGGNGNEVTINWNEISGGVNTGVLTLNVTHCGQTQTIPTNVALHTMPVLTLSLPTFICPGDGTIDVTVNAPGVTTGQLLFSFTNGYTESKSIHSSGNYTITNGFTNATATNITQSLTVTLLNPNGCHYSPSDTKTAEIYPETKITITPGYNVAICLEETPIYSHTLTSNLSTGSTSSANFQWYKNNMPITGWIAGSSGASYVINNTNQPIPQGTYYVAVKDGNNCIVYSNEINVFLYCSEEVDCDITPVPVIAISGEWNCNQIKVTLDYNHEPDSIQWTIGQGVSFTGQNIGVTTAEGYFTSIEPGAHLIFAKLYYGDCFIVRMVEVKKHYQPILSLGASCNTSGTYNVTLNNNSLVFDIDTDDITFEYYDRTTSF